VRSQAMLFKSPDILGDALGRRVVRETSWFESLRDDRQLIRLTDELQATPVRGTNLLRVPMECRNKKDAQIIVRAVVGEWYDTVHQASTTAFTAGALRAAQEEKQPLEEKIQEERDRLRRIQSQLAPGTLEDPIHNLTIEKARENALQVEQLKLELSMIEEYQAIYNNPSGVAITAEDRALVEQDPQILQAQQQLFVLEQAKAADTEKFGPNHPVVLQMDAQIAAVSDTLNNLRTQKVREVRGMRIEQTNTAVDASRQALFLRLESLAQAEEELQDQGRKLLEYRIIEQDVARDLAALVELEDHINSLARVARSQSAITVNIAQPPTEPLERSSPSIVLLPVGLVFALLGAFGIGLTLELMDKSVRTTQDIVRHLDIAMLGAVPDTDDEEVRIDQVETAVRDHPRSMIAEAFRRIRTNLQFSAPADHQRTVLVTGPRPDDGKTTIACNLAMALAQGGRRVLLVDANFRRPALAALLGKTKSAGFSNLLIGEGSLESFVVKTDQPTLDLLGSGPVPPNPAELIVGERARDFLEQTKEKYDQVILDSAPVLVASDALNLSTLVDGVILVVRANRNSRGVARRACRLLSDVGAHMFGAVLNAARVTGGGYFREQLRSYYEYQTEVDADTTPKQIGPPDSKA
ncbi:MAG: polysaccharide biosynthesis tyrosine autokinase, partial [Phycisphaerae bacterium]